MLETVCSCRACSSLVVAAHPDDETLAVGALLAQLRAVSVIHTTDGAPYDRRLFPPGLGLSRERYAAVRREEVLAALALAGVPRERVFSLGVVDQEAVRELPRLVDGLLEHLVAEPPSIVITHAYEGGHPDHDATAFAVHAAIALLRRAGSPAPILLEAASYHGADGRFTPGELLPAPGVPELRVELTACAAAQKRAMLACFASQEHVIATFPIRAERLRVAPSYDFTRPPHDGTLYYERLGWPTTGAELRERARACLEVLDLPVGPCP